MLLNRFCVCCIFVLCFLFWWMSFLFFFLTRIRLSEMSRGGWKMCLFLELCDCVLLVNWRWCNCFLVCFWVLLWCSLEFFCCMLMCCFCCGLCFVCVVCVCLFFLLCVCFWWWCWWVLWVLWICWRRWWICGILWGVSVVNWCVWDGVVWEMCWLVVIDVDYWCDFGGWLLCGMWGG